MISVETEGFVRQSALSVSIEGDALFGETADALATLQRLSEQGALIGEPELGPSPDALARLSERLERRELHVALAGVRGSGKRTLLDALFGDARLGQARGHAEIPTFLSNGATPRYRAVFVDGSSEDFARLVPDRSREHDERLQSAERAFTEAQRAHSEREAQAKTAAEASNRAREAARRVAHDAESALEVEQSTSIAFGAAQQAEQQARQALTAAERGVPVRLRKPVSQLGFWLRLWRALFTLFRRDAWGALERARAALLGAQDRFAAMRERLTEAADQLQQARERTREPQEAAEARRRDADATRALADDARKAMERARIAMEQRREELSRYVADRLARFFDGVRRLCSSDVAARVVELAIEYPSELIPEDVVLIDVPDIRDQKRRQRAHLLLQQVADGCALVWALDHEVGAETVELLRAMQVAVPHVFVVLNKMDATYVEAVREGHAEPWERVEAARADAMAAFAERVGVDASAVVSIAVAAKAALDDPESGLAGRFERELGRLFEMLRQERTILLGTRAMQLLDGCAARVSAAERRAEAAYEARVAELESHRMPEPEAFHQSALRDADPLIDRAADATIEDVQGLVGAGYATLKASLDDFAMSESGSAADLLRRETKLHNGAKKLEAKVEKSLERALQASVAALEARLLSELGNRYRIPDTRAFRSAAPELPAAPELDPLGPPRALALVRSFRRGRVSLAMLGIALGAALGWLATPLVAHAAQLTLPRELPTLGLAVLGSLLAFAKSWSTTRAKAVASIQALLVEQEEAEVHRLDARGPELADAIRNALDASVRQAIIRYGRQMSEPTETRERAVYDERTRLSELQALSDALGFHIAELQTLTENAADFSTFQQR
jgi:sugar-specific transcriptional regulator TrmB